VCGEVLDDPRLWRPEFKQALPVLILDEFLSGPLKQRLPWI